MNLSIMKIQFKLGLLAAGVLVLSSCEKHDLIADNLQIGQYVPTCYWEVGSTACKAGENFTFKGKYYTEEGHTPLRSEVWYNVAREESAAATVMLAGTSLSYTKTVAGIDTVRASQVMASFPHEMAAWNGYEYEIVGSVPVSRTLSPVTWMNLTEWDQERFDMYYPATFIDEFKETVIGYMTDTVTAPNYYNALRTVYCNYEFSNELVGQINQQFGTNLPTDIDIQEGDASASIADKSDRWFSTTEASDKAITGYYYNSIAADSSVVVTEVTKDEVTVAEDGSVILNADSTVVLYPVYKAAEWVFCRYDDDNGAIVSSVRESYLDAFAALLSVIKFEEWIYDGKNYAVTFTRDYSVFASFKVFDTDGNVGVASTSYEITIN